MDKPAAVSLGRLLCHLHGIQGYLQGTGSDHVVHEGRCTAFTSKHARESGTQTAAITGPPCSTLWHMLQELTP